MNLLHIPIHTFIYACVHTYICIEVLSSVFNYRMWLLNSVVARTLKNEYFLLERVCMYLYLKGFPVDNLKYPGCQPMQPIILGSLQN